MNKQRKTSENTCGCTGIFAQHINCDDLAYNRNLKSKQMSGSHKQQFNAAEEEAKKVGWHVNMPIEPYKYLRLDRADRRKLKRMYKNNEKK